MHPIISYRNRNSQRTSLEANQRSLRGRIRATLESWKRRRTIMALRSVNDHWLKGAGIDRDDIEHLVDKVVQRDIPMPVDAEPGSRDQCYRQAAA